MGKIRQQKSRHKPINLSLQEVHLEEPTVTHEDDTSVAHEQKEKRCEEALVEECEEAGWKDMLFAFEVECKVFFGKSTRKWMKVAGLC